VEKKKGKKKSKKIMKIKKFNESIRDKMTPKDVDELKYNLFLFAQDIEERMENDDEVTVGDVNKIYDYIKEYTGINDPMEMINFLIEKKFITPNKILILIKESGYGRNTLQPFDYYDESEIADYNTVEELIDLLKRI
jgi:hypothetical protein